MGYMYIGQLRPALQVVNRVSDDTILKVYKTFRKKKTFKIVSSPFLDWDILGVMDWIRIFYDYKPSNN